MVRKKDPFCDAVDRFIIRQTIEDNEKYLAKKKEQGAKPGSLKNSFSPSFISSKECLRAWYYHYLKTKKDGDIDPKLQRVFANGHKMHDRVQRMLQRMGVLAVLDTEIGIVDTDWMVKGFVDGVVQRKKGEVIHRLVLEIKSINSWGFGEVERKGPQKKHKLQANIYMWLLDLEEAIIYYECKNSQQHCSCIIKYNPKLIDKKIKANITKVLENVKEEDIPNICYNETVKECEWCDWKEACQKEGGKKRKNLITI